MATKKFKMSAETLAKIEEGKRLYDEMQRKIDEMPEVWRKAWRLKQIDEMYGVFKTVEDYLPCTYEPVKI